LESFFPFFFKDWNRLTLEEMKQITVYNQE
jgi:hypothetical protein